MTSSMRSKKLFKPGRQPDLHLVGLLPCHPLFLRFHVGETASSTPPLAGDVLLAALYYRLLLLNFALSSGRWSTPAAKSAFRSRSAAASATTHAAAHTARGSGYSGFIQPGYAAGDVEGYPFGTAAISAASVQAIYCRTCRASASEESVRPAFFKIRRADDY